MKGVGVVEIERMERETILETKKRKDLVGEELQKVALHLGPQSETMLSLPVQGERTRGEGVEALLPETRTEIEVPETILIEIEIEIETVLVGIDPIEMVEIMKTVEEKEMMIRKDEGVKLGETRKIVIETGKETMIGKGA